MRDNDQDRFWHEYQRQQQEDERRTLEILHEEKMRELNDERAQRINNWLNLIGGSIVGALLAVIIYFTL